MTIYTPRDPVWIFPLACFLWVFCVYRELSNRELSNRELEPTLKCVCAQKANRKLAKVNAKLRRRIQALDTKYAYMMDQLELKLVNKLDIYNAENHLNFVMA